MFLWPPSGFLVISASLLFCYFFLSHLSLPLLPRLSFFFFLRPYFYLSNLPLPSLSSSILSLPLPHLPFLPFPYRCYTYTTFTLPLPCLYSPPFPVCFFLNKTLPLSLFLHQGCSITISPPHVCLCVQYLLMMPGGEGAKWSR